MLERVGRFDPGVPVERASTPPADWYVDAEFHELERRSVFRRAWLAVGRDDQLAAAGDYVAGEVAGEPYVVVRDGERLRAFFNVCRHHATCLVEGEGRIERFICPYHGWRYDLDGRLRAAPRMAGLEGFDREDHGLVPMEAGAWGPLVFARIERGGPALAELLRPLDGRLRLDGLRFAARRVWEIECNWKVFVDNYLDGGYHVEHLHRGLAGQLDLDGYRTEVDGAVSLQSCGGTGERIGEGAAYAFVYPNLMLNRYGPVLDTNVVLPLGPSRTLTVFDWWFDESVADDAAFVERSIAASVAVQQEDVDVCRAVQRGLRSSAFDTGRYAPRVEHAMHRFHCMLHADLMVGARGTDGAAGAGGS